MMTQINGAEGDMKYALLPSLTPGSIYPGSISTGETHMSLNQSVLSLLVASFPSRARHARRAAGCA
jgi:hypothetical protein